MGNNNLRRQKGKGLGGSGRRYSLIEIFGMLALFPLLLQFYDFFSLHNDKNEDNEARRTCSCVDCDEDKVCGGLWRGVRYPGMVESDEELLHKKLHLVVSHCKTSLSWMQDYLKGFTNVGSIHVISKCGHGVEGDAIGAEVLVLPNVGRCDHSYAHFITTILPKLAISKNDNSIVVFLKDTTMEEFEENGTFMCHSSHIGSQTYILLFLFMFLHRNLNY
jgi:hypothetical protein